MDIKVLDPMGVEVNQEAVEPKGTEQTPVVGELLTQSVGQLFNLKPREIDNERERINLLIDYARTQTEDRSPEGIKWAIRSLQGRVGTPPLGEKWLSYLGKYAYIKLESLKMQKEVEKYEHND